MKLIRAFILFFIAVKASAQYNEFHLNEKEYAALTCEIPKYSSYVEYGYFVLNIEDTASFYIEQKIAFGRFRADTLENYLSYNIPVNLVEGNIIPLINFNNISDYYLTTKTHKIPYIKYSGILVLLLNDLELPKKEYTINTDSEYYNSLIKVFFDLVNIDRKLLK